MLGFLDYLVVCYLTDRNELRSRVIEWLQSEVEPDGWISRGSNLSDVLLNYFQVCVCINILIYWTQCICFQKCRCVSHFYFMLFVFQQNYDNGDAQLDSTEFLKFIQHNETAINITSPYAEEENKRLLRSHAHTHARTRTRTHTHKHTHPNTKSL